MSAREDLARLLVPPAGEDFTIRQGTIRAFDPATFANEIEYDGLRVENVNVASGLEALTYVPGDVVLLEGWFPGGKKGELGIGSIWIRGRVITPGPDAAQQVIAPMTTSLGRAVAAEVFADRIASVDADDNVISGDTSGGWVSLTGGPQLSGVEIGPTGRALVTVSADVLCAPTGSVGRVEGWMGFEISGATSVSPDIFDTLRVRYTRDADTAGNTAVNVAASRVNLVEGLNEGVHTFKAQYRVIAGAGDEAEFQGRNLTVIAF